MVAANEAANDVVEATDAAVVGADEQEIDVVAAVSEVVTVIDIANSVVAVNETANDVIAANEAVTSLDISAELVSAKVTINDMKNLVLCAEDVRRNCKKVNEESQMKIAAMEKDLQAKHLALTKKDSVITGLKQNIESMNDELNEKNTMIKQLEEKIKKLHSLHKIKEKEVETSNASNDLLQIELAQVETELKESVKQNSIYETTINEVRDQNTQIKNNSKVRNNYTELSEDLKSMHKDYVDFKKFVLTRLPQVDNAEQTSELTLQKIPMMIERRRRRKRRRIRRNLMGGM